MINHTKGPWNAVLGEFWTVEALDGQRVANTLDSECLHMGPEEHDDSQANAYLIAAAPDMLEALENLENDSMRIPSSAWNLVKAAIQKAKAGSNHAYRALNIDYVQGLKVDAERFRFISSDAESSLERAYGSDWLSVVDDLASIKKISHVDPPKPPMMRIGECGDRWDQSSGNRISADTYFELTREHAEVENINALDDAYEAMYEIELHGFSPGDAIRHQNDVIVDLLNSLGECLPCLGWESESIEELYREHELGNGYAELIIRAREAVAKAKEYQK